MNFTHATLKSADLPADTRQGAGLSGGWGVTGAQHDHQITGCPHRAEEWEDLPVRKETDS